MKLPKIVWHNQILFKKTPLILVLAVAVFIGFNVFLNLKIKNAKTDLAEIEQATTKPPRQIQAEFTKKVILADKQCPSATAGNPNAPLKFKLFESETCPFCVAEDKVIDQLLPEYGDLFYAEWYPILDCQKQAEDYKISGVPTFIFTAQGVEKPPAYGFLDKGQLSDYICKVSGQC